MHKEVGYCQEVTTIMAEALDEIYTYTGQCLELFFPCKLKKIRLCGRDERFQ